MRLCVYRAITARRHGAQAARHRDNGGMLVAIFNGILRFIEIKIEELS